MKLILQLVVVPNAQTNFRDNLLKFSLNVIHKVASQRVSMGLTDRRKTAKNLVDSRKN